METAVSDVLTWIKLIKNYTDIQDLNASIYYRGRLTHLYKISICINCPRFWNRQYPTSITIPAAEPRRQ